jgi:Tol biopolymer transport system component
VLIDVATRSARVIATGTIQGVSFSPDSTRLAYARAPNLKTFPTFSDIYTVPLAGGSPTRITRNHRSTEPVWGPAKIAFARTFKARGRREDAPKSNVWLMNPDGSTVLAATGGFDPGSGHNIVSVPFAGGPITTLVRNAFAPTWND